VLGEKGTKSERRQHSFQCRLASASLGSVRLASEEERMQYRDDLGASQKRALSLSVRCSARGHRKLH